MNCALKFQRNVSLSKYLSQNMTHVRLNDFETFKKTLDESKNIIVLTGAGISAESGIPVFRGAGGLWRTHRAEELATPEAFNQNPGLVWEFYHYRREVAFNALPNKAHFALKYYEDICKKENRQFTIITQNVDGLHTKAGSTNILEIHGSLRKIRCSKCEAIAENITQPLCEALRGRGDPKDRDENLPKLTPDQLPKCAKCQGLVRPHIVWFGESLDSIIMDKCYDLVASCDMCLLVGTSSVIFPAAQFAPTVASNGKPVAEFNINKDPASHDFAYYFSGPCGATLPKAFGFDNK